MGNATFVMNQIAVVLHCLIGRIRGEYLYLLAPGSTCAITTVCTVGCGQYIPELRQTHHPRVATGPHGYRIILEVAEGNVVNVLLTDDFFRRLCSYFVLAGS